MISDIKIKKEDLALVDEAIKMWEEGITTKPIRLQFLGLISIIEFYYLEDMERINIHSPSAIISITMVQLNSSENSSKSFTALRYTLDKLRLKIEKDIKSIGGE